MDQAKLCMAATSFAISCGTATFDINIKPMPVLLIRWRRTGEYFLPKGRKDIGETLEQAAERETFEETGYVAKIFPARFETRATGSLNAHGTLTEPIALTQRLTGGVLKTIFWFVASADSNASKVKNTQQDDEDFESHWIPIEQARATLSWPDDRTVLDEAAKAVQSTTK